MSLQVDCDAEYDPSCYATRRTHREVAWRGFGTYREGCTFKAGWNAWACPGGASAHAFAPARLIVESMDADHTSRSLTPVSLCSGGYCDLMNGGWDHQSPVLCGGYSCRSRLMTFHTTVALNRSYDLAFTGTNPQSLRLVLPHADGREGGSGEAARVTVGIFYSSPYQLQERHGRWAVSATVLVVHTPTTHRSSHRLSTPAGVLARSSRGAPRVAPPLRQPGVPSPHTLPCSAS